MKLRSIQLLRGLAVLLVVFYHMRGVELRHIAEAGVTETPLLGGLWINGYAGVDLFFAISGFIMIYIAGHTPRGLRGAASFAFSRVTRIYPLWWLCAACMVVYFMVAYGVPLDLERAQALGQTPQDHLLKSFLLLPQNNLPVLVVGWTLVHELYFYLVFTLLLLLVPLKLRIPALLLWGVIVAWGALRGFSGPHHLGALELVFSPLTLEFIGGAMAGVAVRGGLRRPAAVTGLVGGIGFLLALYMVPGVPEPGLAMLEWGRVLWFGLPSVLLVYAFAAMEVDRKLFFLIPLSAALLSVIGVAQVSGLGGWWLVAAAVLIGALTYLVTLLAVSSAVVKLRGRATPSVTLARARTLFDQLMSALVRLGDQSYALYLTHMLALNGLMLGLSGLAGQAWMPAPVANGMVLGEAGHLDNWILAVASVSVAITMGWLTHRWFEAPLVRWFGQLRGRLFAKPGLPAVQN